MLRVLAFLGLLLVGGAAHAQPTITGGCGMNASPCPVTATNGVTQTLGVWAAQIPPLSLTSTVPYVLFGDSISANSDDNSLGTYSGGVITPKTPCTTSCFTYATLGYGSWLNFYTSERIQRVPNTGNFGIVGDTCVDMDTAARMNPVLASGARLVVMDCGYNDIATAASTPAQIIAANYDMYSQFLSRGIVVIKIGVYPGGTNTSTQNLQASQVNQADRQYAATGHSGFYFIDMDGVMTDPSQSTWTRRSGYEADNIHPSAIGASAMAWAIANVVNQIVPAYRNAAISNSDIFDATNNTTGNLLTNGAMQGSGGSLSGGCSGTLASSSSLTGVSGVGCAATAGLQLSNGAYYQNITLSGSYTNASPIVNFAMGATSLSNFSQGDVVEGCIWVRLTGTTTNIAGLAAALLPTENAISYQRVGMFGLSYSQPFPSTGFPVSSFFPVCTPRHTVTTSPTTEVLSLWIQLIGGTSLTAAASVDVAAFELRKVQ